jgi:hypothetical protein
MNAVGEVEVKTNTGVANHSVCQQCQEQDVKTFTREQNKYKL